MSTEVPDTEPEPSGDGLATGDPGPPAPVVLAYKLYIVLDERSMKKLKRAQSLLSRNSNSKASIPETVERAVDQYLEKHCPERRKARRLRRAQEREEATKRKLASAPDRTPETTVKRTQEEAAEGTPTSPPEGTSEETPESTPTAPKRDPISAALRDAVQVRDGGACTYIGRNGKRCNSTHQIQVDHELPLALGGRTVLENLRSLCRAHNQREADRLLGRRFMDAKRRRKLLRSTPATGVDGAEVDAAGMDAAGVDAAEVDATGIDGAGVDGAGVDAAGVDGAGIDAAGVDGAGIDAEGGDASRVDAGVDGREHSGSKAAPKQPASG